MLASIKVLSKRILLPFSMPLFFGPVHQQPVYMLPSLKADSFDIVLQGAFAWRSIKGAKPHEIPAAPAVNEMESQTLIGYTHEFLQHRRLDHGLIAVHAGRASFSHPRFWVRSCHDCITYATMALKDLGHGHCISSAKLMPRKRSSQFWLNIMFLAHCGSWLMSFLISVVGTLS